MAFGITRRLRARRLDAAIGAAEALADDGHDALALAAYRQAMEAIIAECRLDPDAAELRSAHAPILRMALLLERRMMRAEALETIERWRTCGDKPLPRTEGAMLCAIEAWMRAGFRVPYPAALAPAA
jgi:hypothetical protein